MLCRFEDSRGWCCAAFNEVSIDYNAAFTGALARLVAFYDNMKPFSDCTLDLGWTHPNATLVRPQCPSLAYRICLGLSFQGSQNCLSLPPDQSQVGDVLPYAAAMFSCTRNFYAFRSYLEDGGVVRRLTSHSGLRTTATTAAATARSRPHRPLWPPSRAAARRAAPLPRSPRRPPQSLLTR